MTPLAHVAASVEILDAILCGTAAERCLSRWARRNRFAGSRDRAAIRDLVFGALRCRRSLAWLGGAEDGRGLMIGHLRRSGIDPCEVFTGAGFAPGPLNQQETQTARRLEDAPSAVRLDCPDWLWPHMKESLGGGAEPILALMQRRAPVFLRINTARTDSATVQEALAADGIETKSHPLCGTALEVTWNARRVRLGKAFRNGLVELQDISSQAVVEHLSPYARGRRVLDYCAGGGGKALALAAGGAGTVTAHDSDVSRMADIPVRAERAATPIDVTDAPKGEFELVLCDVPCSGTGAWRRRPEAKWSLTDASLVRLCSLQDEILDTASRFVAPGGVLAYSTCSLLNVENEGRVDAFLRRQDDWWQIDSERFTPLDGGDGFFLALLGRDGERQAAAPGT
ncbi:MAG: RsmB/NOP family class I SAM-dependent RNA methyltransferase [Boseongicola sp. SB0676_bin_33]|nr:RsmB/NOP family class I SAM-dependent RNA methyltransferase [Boseongicola sp. SB0676_bin_33]MYK31228.1 RsmB/NOP family class I SAM-dependent RNA methyltransferase [Boseongicola sp. SB0670_bin_30]